MTAPDPAHEEWLFTEAKLLAHRNHPAVPTTYHYWSGHAGNKRGPGYLRRWVTGETVGARMRRLGTETIPYMLRVLRAAKGNQAGLVTGATMVAVVQELFAVFARRGLDAAADGAISQLEDKLVEVLNAGLARAEKELGRRLDLPTLPTTLAALVGAWLRGEAAVLDPDNPIFKELFAQLAERASASV